MKTLIPLLLLIITGCNSSIKTEGKQNQDIKQIIKEKLGGVKIPYDAILVEGSPQKKKITLSFDEYFKFSSIDMKTILANYIVTNIITKYDIHQIEMRTKIKKGLNNYEKYAIPFTYNKPIQTAKVKLITSRNIQVMAYLLQNLDDRDYRAMQTMADRIATKFHLDVTSSKFLDILFKYTRIEEKTFDVDNDADDKLIALMIYYTTAIIDTGKAMSKNGEIPLYPEVTKGDEESLLFAVRSIKKMIDLLILSGAISKSSDLNSFVNKSFKNFYDIMGDKALIPIKIYTVEFNGLGLLYRLDP